MSYFILFFIGIIIGSFLNVVIDRIPRGETIWFGRSHCEYCQHVLSWYDLFPLFSFLLLRGKCRYCHKFIGWKYPIVEATTGVLFVLALLTTPLTSIVLILNLFVLGSLTIILYTDLFSGIIPDSVLVLLFFFTILRVFVLHQNILNCLASGICAGLLFLFLHVVTRGRGMGFGDVKYAVIMGALLGFPFIIAGLYIAFLTGAVLALILVIVKKKTFASAIPFGPFLVLGTVVNFFWGSYVWAFFLHLLNL